MAMTIPITQQHLQEDCVLPLVLAEQTGRSGGQSERRTPSEVPTF